MDKTTENFSLEKEQPLIYFKPPAAAEAICWEIINLIGTGEECQEWLMRVQSRLEAVQVLADAAENILQSEHISSFQLSDAKKKAEERYMRYQRQAANCKFYQHALENKIEMLKREEVCNG